MSEDAPPKKKFSAGALLKKQGWSEGGGLGKDLQGRNTYVTVKKNNQDLGVGADMGKFKENDVKVWPCCWVSRTKRVLRNGRTQPVRNSHFWSLVSTVVRSDSAVMLPLDGLWLNASKPLHHSLFVLQ